MCRYPGATAQLTRGFRRLWIAGAFIPPDAACYGQLNKYTGASWQTRFFVLRGGVLLYYVAATSPEPKVCAVFPSTRAVHAAPADRAFPWACAGRVPRG